MSVDQQNSWSTRKPLRDVPLGPKWAVGTLKSKEFLQGREDLLVVLVGGQDKTPVAKVIKQKLTVADLKQDYREDAIVYL